VKPGLSLWRKSGLQLPSACQWPCKSPEVSFCPTVSQWELKPTLPFPSCFLYNPKFLASQLLGLPAAFTLVSCLAYLTLKMEVICSSETLVDFQQTTWRYIQDESTLQGKWNCSHYHVQNGQGAHPVSYPMCLDRGLSSHRQKSKKKKQIKLCGSLPTQFHTPSWCAV
jgi:hypothetical protein